MLSVGIITAATGNPLLVDAVRSIDNQEYDYWHHYLFYDGVISYETFCRQREEYASERRHCAYWPSRIGGKGLEGRRLYAAAPSLINEDITIILNEDDWFLPNHIESLVNLIEKDKLDWAYSLRRVYDKQGNFLFNDNCESLGKWPVWHDAYHHMVETCSYAVKTPIMLNVANVYNYRGFGPDRLQYDFLSKNYPKFDCTGLYSMCFRLGGNPGSVSREFFERGNDVMKERYGFKFPWAK